MPTTRSAGKAQTKLDDFKKGNELQPRPSTKAAKSKAPAKPNSRAKRKRPSEDDTVERPSKNSKEDSKPAKQTHFLGDSTTDLEKPIVINRSPVLQLWGASVAQFMHPTESWETCLSIGAAIAALCAVAKGRSIGQIEPKDDSAEADKKRKDKKQEAKKDSRELEVMGFPMHIKNDVVVMDGKPKPLNETLLKKKFGGDEPYNALKNIMLESLQAWEDDQDELEKKAFHMYEKFRPNVASGQRGWGRKGELNINEVKNTISR